MNRDWFYWSPLALIALASTGFPVIVAMEAHGASDWVMVVVLGCMSLGLCIFVASFAPCGDGLRLCDEQEAEP